MTPNVGSGGGSGMGGATGTGGSGGTLMGNSGFGIPGGDQPPKAGRAGGVGIGGRTGAAGSGGISAAGDGIEKSHRDTLDRLEVDCLARPKGSR